MAGTALKSFVVTALLVSGTVFGQYEDDDDMYGGFDEDMYGDDMYDEDYGDYDDYGDYGGYDDYDDYGGADAPPPVPGLLDLDAVSLRKLRKTSANLLVQILENSWSDSEILEELAESLEDNDDVITGKIIAEDGDDAAADALGLADDVAKGSGLVLYQAGKEPFVLQGESAADYEASLTIRIDQQISELLKAVRQSLADPSAVEVLGKAAESATDGSDVYRRIGKFLSVTARRAANGDLSQSLRNEKARISNLLLMNVENISEEKIAEFYSRLHVLDELLS
mmetsp:Transcript_14333/g.40702  ORF Transcript_14333/g.40702 Transcript_14333/m.40702 type:complete len:282 (+) Transcript_14333:74-919(+)|eukprot:CAMPEP_0119124910 /NCGR_PEP_ID=MMETSP1310-20130426/4373_1 /TAXON_ID=464262 /ORGANISM="Genus nov. species nov., Strain RCC2339" /LENGTH=281 /DNA_ID=CAMNT_0007114923 /DNA_START=74 /DNA_END=919 /DNA_ORIENTATION=-